MDERAERSAGRTVTLVVPLPDRAGRTTGDPYVERADRPDEPVRAVRTEPEQPVRTVRPEPVETVRPAAQPPTVRPEPTVRLIWQEVAPADEQTVRTIPPSDGGRTHLKIAAGAIPATALAGIICGLVSSLWPLAALAGTGAAGALVALLVRFARWLTESIVRDAQ